MTNFFFKFILYAVNKAQSLEKFLHLGLYIYNIIICTQVCFISYTDNKLQSDIPAAAAAASLSHFHSLPS